MPLFIEAPANFYLGRRYDPAAREVEDDVVYYDARDLTTHAVVVGMTGSGKTGLCITLLEEAILDNIPAIIIDPKGDITNLMLNFPDLRPEDFQPWINVDDAHRAGMDVPQFAGETAQQWRDGLASWGIVPDRMRWLKHVARYSIFTPGSDAGLPVSILASLRAPREGWAGNEEANREKISSIVTALLALVGRTGQAIQEKAHVLLANIFEYAWMRGEDLTVENVILQVQRPPFSTLGVFPVDEYMAEKDRRKLAIELNSIVASPSFQSWLQGEPLDVQRLLFGTDGQPRVSIFYIAHLPENERQFIMTLLLQNVNAWLRTQTGTTSLRALLYIDEVFGYFPPYPRNPPTKEPLLRLLKQARAFGLGLILATQNPGDLDYKGLSNAGTWFIGRLQSENDKNKVMAGLEQLSTVNNEMDLREASALISDIPPRVFLMHNVHEDTGPILLHTRWAMSYLRGPLARQQIQTLMAAQRAQLIAQQTAARQPYGQQGGYAQESYSAPPQGAPAAGGFGFAAQMAAAQSAAPAYPPTPPGYGAPPPPPNLPELPPGLPEFPPAAPTLRQRPTFGGTPMPPPRISDGGYGAPPSFPAQNAEPDGYDNAPADPYVERYVSDRAIQPAAPAFPSSPQPERGLSAPSSNRRLPPGFTERAPQPSAAAPYYFLPPAVSGDQALNDWSRRTQFAATSSSGALLVYQPGLLAQATVRYQDRKTALYTVRAYAYRIPTIDSTGIVDWEGSRIAPIDKRRISGEAYGAAMFGEMPEGLADSRRLTALKREMIDAIYNTGSLRLPSNTPLGLFAGLDEDPGAFRARVQQVAREKRDAEMDSITAKYEAQIDKLDDSKRRKAQRLTSEQRELEERKREQLFTTGESVLGLMRGRTAFTLSRMSSASVRKEISKGQAESLKLDLREMEGNQQQMVEQFETTVRQINEKWARAATQIDEYIVTPYKKDITADLFGIGWTPYWYVIVNGQALLLPATE